VSRLLPLAILLALPAAAGAVEPVVALRLGLAAGLGDAARDVPLSDVVPVQYPLQLDVLGREGPLALGAYGALALGHAGRCPGASCSARAARVGLQGTWTLGLEGGAEPWLGLAAGLEWIFERRTEGGTVKASYRGIAPLALQGGVEWRVWRWVALGPYGALALGRYDRYSVDTGLESASVSIPHRSWHAWVEVGVRGRLVLEARR
jgi:hypothetical protein